MFCTIFCLLLCSRLRYLQLLLPPLLMWCFLLFCRLRKTGAAIDCSATPATSWWWRLAELVTRSGEVPLAGLGKGDVCHLLSFPERAPYHLSFHRRALCYRFSFHSGGLCHLLSSQEGALTPVVISCPWTPKPRRTWAASSAGSSPGRSWVGLSRPHSLLCRGAAGEGWGLGVSWG